MKMRAFAAALALFGLAACGQATPPASPTGGYTMQVLASRQEQFYLVTTPEGGRVAARAGGGTSEIVTPEQVESAVGERLGVFGQATEQHVTNIFGVNVAVAGDDAEPGKERARVAVNVQGREVLVDAQEHDGNARESAAVRINGASADEARSFVHDADELSAETKAEMLRQLGL
jgi:hypothetical protein